MQAFQAVINAVSTIFSNGWYLFIHGFWVVFLALAVFIGYYLYMEHINGKYVKGFAPWTVLQIRVEKDNLQSTLAVEQIFAQLHALHTNYTWAEKYLEGKVLPWFTFEIVSIGGKIHYFACFPHRIRNLIESAFYSRYPNAEITEVTDYMAPLKDWDPWTSPWDLWGTEFKFLKDYAYPIRTYKDFEHPTAEEKIIDPLSAMLEALNKTEPHEMFGIQYTLQPIADLDWTPHVTEFALKLKKEFLSGAKAGEGKADPDETGAPQILTEGQKKILSAIEFKASKTGYTNKIRLLYVAPKDKMDGSKRAALIGGFRQLSGMLTNGLKPDISQTWTNYQYKIFKNLEQPYVDYQIRKKKKKFITGFANRASANWIGAKKMIMNTEELATIFHFPLASSAMPPIESVGVKKGQPPADLPII